MDTRKEKILKIVKYLFYISMIYLILMTIIFMKNTYELDQQSGISELEAIQKHNSDLLEDEQDSINTEYDN